MAGELIKMEHICKEFPGVKALDDVTFELKAGEVHALVGENGAGKSTLMKVLTGVYTKDSGKILLNGEEISINNVRDAQRKGIIMIHQELNLMNHLTAAQNIFIGREYKTKAKVFLDAKTQNQEAKKLFERLNQDIDPTVKVGDLTVAKQQMVEIAKALSYDSKILIMDEPTAALTDNEIEDLFRVIRMLREEGRAIIHISHRLEELKQISDRITVMRDGGYVDTVNTKDTSIDQIIKMMVGREIFVTKQDAFTQKDNKVTLEVRNLNAGRMVRNVTFQAREGEILGLAGLVGAGRTETARAIFGADPHESGEILVHGKPVKISSPSDAVNAGIAYLSEDRKRYGLALGLSVDENVCMADMTDFLKALVFINFKKSRDNTTKQKESLSIKTPSIKQKVKLLSGGNQQKVVLAKWLTRNSDILIFDEPTRGIDIGAKNEIYKLMNQLAAEGKTIIVISSELPEIIRTCHRVLVMCEGRITGEVTGDEIDQNVIMGYATKREA
ncbi:sugar ABC transporter ATP-binding protein [Diplocloster agilis]|uniref:sugar ABC transporter ATP-binding protein n=1 Tax=Diplocloster agilis TaxID=2850323 RepID=UPI0008233B4A|nr:MULTISPECIES: sugar ABC transporter ATP-binding protein [Lachnospiraceae]MBU9745729.1 sugar ABC transporter ATP-binding protein [Diplocloster agilis]MCU6735220.1 sugar ABC transporter ATP-binding protein [Suonthocola fibrivorans]SCJ67815.1 Ribose import ATP-binding protein RbsA [uncultured Clostridium sp.]